MRRRSVTSDMMKSYIADSLLLLMEKREFQDITVGEIVEKAGVNRSTYYRHFSKKEDVILYFLDELSASFVAWEALQTLSFEEHLTKLYEHYAAHKTQMLTIYKSGLSSLFLEVLRKYLGGWEHTDKQPSEQYAIAFHLGGTFNQFMLWFSREMVDPPEVLAKYTLAVLSERSIPFIQKANHPAP